MHPPLQSLQPLQSPPLARAAPRALPAGTPGGTPGGICAGLPAASPGAGQAAAVAPGLPHAAPGQAATRADAPARSAPAASAAPATPGRAEDAALVARALAGEAAAFAAIMRRHNRLLFRAARAVVHDDAEAQDVVQEAYLRAFTRLVDFRGDAALGTWLARICLRTALDALRRRARSVALVPAPDLGLQPPPEHDAMPFHAPPEDAPEQALARLQLRLLLESAVQGLPPLYRSVFVLRAVQEMSVQETAFCLDISQELVRTRYLRSRALLRDALGARIEACTDSVFAVAGPRCDQVVQQVLGGLRQRGLLR